VVAVADERSAEAHEGVDGAATDLNTWSRFNETFFGRNLRINIDWVQKYVDIVCRQVPGI
jgi:hypothetical protein